MLPPVKPISGVPKEEFHWNLPTPRGTVPERSRSIPPIENIPEALLETNVLGIFRGVPEADPPPRPSPTRTHVDAEDHAYRLLALIHSCPIKGFDGDEEE